MKSGVFMKRKSASLIVTSAFLILSGRLLFTGTTSNPLRSGRVISSTLSGHGPENEGKSKNVLRTDIWWSYCISTGNASYSVLSRESPSKTGLAPNSLIKFSEKKKLIYITRPDGKRISLRILRKDKTGKCP
jgi:hypothetical protein